MRDPNNDGRPWRYSLVEHQGGRPEPAPYGYGQGYGQQEFDPRAYAAYAQAAYAGGAPQERNMSEIFRNLWRRKMTILAGMFACAVIAYIVAVMMPPRYSAGGMLAVETRPLFIPQIGVQPQPWAPDVSIPRTEVQVLRSRDLVESVARKLNLDQQPDLNPLAEEPSLFGHIQNGIRAVLAAIGIGRPAVAPSENAIWSGVVDKVLENLSIGTDGKSYAIYVGFESENPETSAAVANGLMQAFISKQIENSTNTLTEANSWIKQRATELLKDVEEANKKVQDFRVANNMVETRLGSVSSQQVSDINTQLSTARADLAQADARYRQAQGESGRGASTFEVLNSPLIQSLRVREAEAAQRQAEMATRYAPAHPQRKAVAQELASIRGQISAEINKQMTSLKNQADIARSRVDSLSRQLNGLEGRATNMAASEMQLRQLEQEAETKRNVYQSFLATAQQTGDQPRINQANARIVSAAPVPTTPSSPNKKLIVLGSLLIGFFATSAAVLLLGEMRRGFERTEDDEESLGLPVLGALPLMRRRRSERGGLGQSFIGQPHESVIAETLRGIRIALGARRSNNSGGSANALAHNRAKVLLVTSSEPNEGKTTFTSSFGAVAAQDGLRVLIVDGDLRRPQFHRMFKAEPGPALDDILHGTQNLANVVRTDPESGAHCLTMHHVDHPVALLSSGYWETFLQQARNSYDLIVMDSPPVMHVADALTLADHVDSAIFVVAYGSTRRRMVEEALKRFATSGCRVAGIVLSKVPSLQTTHSYYSGYAA